MLSKLRAAAAAMVLGVSVLAGASVSRAADAPPPTRPVDLVICLDVSGSMDGLIDSARRKLWDVANELAQAKPTPRLRVALVTYGCPLYGAESGFVRIDSPFTEDLDAIYQKLFALRTNGGDEYVARAIKTALEQLAWSDRKDALKLVFVCGNEPADQDRTVDFRAQCHAALEKGVNVNSIYCGPANHPETALWREVARLGEGHFASIDQDHGIVEVATPFDRKLAELSAELNKTYLAYGAEGERGAANQAAQDANATSLGGSAAAGRAQAKAGALYRCDWDLVDACREKKCDLEKAKAEELPEPLRKMTVEERKAFVEKTSARRAEVQKQINELNVQRQGFIAEELKKQGQRDKNGLDDAVRGAIRTQAEKKGFAFEGK